MANIHGFRDYENNDPEAGRGYGQQQQQQANYQAGGGWLPPPPSAEGMGIPLVPPPTQLLPSLGERFVPRYNKRTFTFLVSVLELILFIVTLIVGGVVCHHAFVKENQMAGPSTQTLYLMGGKWTYDIQRGHIWKLFTPIFLHVGIIHIFSNLFFQLHFGFTFEMRWGTPRFIAIYILCGIGSSLLSAVASPDSVAVGASGALAGIMGADLTYLLINWVEIPQNKLELCNIVFVLILNALIGISSASGATTEKIDNYGHLGGLLTGITCAAFMCPHLVEHPKLRLYKGVGLATTGGYFLLLCSLLWGVTKASPWVYSC